MTSSVRSSSAKRSASGNLSNSSDDEQDELRDITRLSVSSVDTGFETASSLDISDNPCSPGASSTSSGPIYLRPPGFSHHAQEITRPRIKKKKKIIAVNNLDGTSMIRKREPAPPKHRQKRDPLPMRMRAFPQSFWQQPNQPVAASPAHCHKVLPPLSIKDDLDSIRPVSPDDTKTAVPDTSHTANKAELKPKQKPERKIIISGNPDSLLGKLFENIEEKTPMSKKNESLIGVNSKTPVPPTTGSVKRNRMKKIFSTNKTMMHGFDPYMMDTITDKLFPHLTLEKGGVKTVHHSTGNTSIQLITLREGDKSVTLPSLCVEQNYSQMLSDLVPHL